MGGPLSAMNTALSRRMFREVLRSPRLGLLLSALSSARKLDVHGDERADEGHCSALPAVHGEIQRRGAAI